MAMPASPSNLNNPLPEVAVVILNWNGLTFLQRFLPGVLASGYQRLRVIVADNASTDESVNWIIANHPSVEIIRHRENKGYAGGYNLALAQVKSDYYILLNSDVEVTPNWIEPMVQLLESDQSIAACQPKMLDHRHRDKFEYAGACGGWIDHYGYPFARGRVFQTCEEDTGQYDQQAPCFWASGAALFIRATDFHSAGGFDEYFFAHQEEVDLCWRLQLAGKQIYCEPQSVVFHVGGGTLPVNSPNKTYLNFRNNLVMLHKNLPKGKLFKTIFVRLVLDGMAGMQFLLKGKVRMMMVIIKAHFHYYGWILKHRHKSVVTREFSLKGYFKGSVVWAYFFRGKRTFSEITGWR